MKKGGVPFRRRGLGAGQLGDVPFRHRFLIFYLFFELWRKKNEAGNSLNAVEREPVETRVLNPTAIEGKLQTETT